MSKIQSAFWVEQRTDLPKWLTDGIGRIAIEWAALKWEYEETIRCQLGVQIEDARIVATGMNIRSRRTVVVNFLQSHIVKLIIPSSLLGEVIALNKRSENLETERNKLVHGLWGLVDGDWNVLRASGSRSFHEVKPDLKKLSRSALPQREPVNKKGLYKTVQAIRDLRQDVEEWRTRLAAALPSSPYESPKQLRQNHPQRARMSKATRIRRKSSRT